MDRDTILASFQEISQIQDFEECIQILESVNWDLQSAVNNMDQSTSSPIVENRMEHEFMSFSPIIGSRHFVEPNRKLKFNINIKGKMISVNISDNKTIADLTKLVASELNEPNTRIQIQFNPNYEEHTVLRNMQLPLINDVDAIILGSDESTVACTSTTRVPSKIYNLCINIYINGEFSQILPLPFSGKDSIDKVKSHLASLTGTDKSNQKWIGWPSNICGTEITLEESGISENYSLTVYIGLNNKTPRRTNDFTTPSFDVSLNNSREMDNEEDDYADDDYTDDIDLMDNVTETCKKRTAALMDSNAHLDPIGAVIQFNTEFSNRYCLQPSQYTSTSKADPSVSVNMTPPFFMGSIDEAISSTLNLSPNERKPLFLYLHHGESIQANIFCTQILCYSEVCLFFMQSEYTIWPWDVTYPENKNKLISWIMRNFGSNVSSRLKIVNKDQYPVIVVISKSQGVTEIMEIIDGMRTKEETVAHLWDIKNKFEEAQLPDIRAWEEMQLRDLVKQEQDAAYRESLLQDQEKEQKKNNENQRKKDEEEKAKMEKEKVSNDRRDKILNAALTLPKEPEDGLDTITIRLRVPLNAIIASSDSLTRRFLESHTLADLIAFVESLGFLSTEYKLLMTYPRKNLTEITDRKVTLKHLGIPKRETLIVELL